MLRRSWWPIRRRTIPTAANPTDAAGALVRWLAAHLAGLGLPQDDIAKLVGCAPKTLRKPFRDELDRGVVEANATVIGYLLAAAKAGNIAAIIFWLKTRAHWRERVAANDPSTNADVGSNSDMVLVLPDNSRDPELTQLLQEAQQKYFARKRQQRQLPPSGT